MMSETALIICFVLFGAFSFIIFIRFIIFRQESYLARRLQRTRRNMVVYPESILMNPNELFRTEYEQPPLSRTTENAISPEEMV